MSVQKPERTLLKSWKLQDARSHFSELIDRAATGEPQVVTRHGEEVAVIVSYAQFRKLEADSTSLLEALTGGPKLPGREAERLFSRRPGNYREVEF